MTTDISHLIFAFAVGAVIGVFFFGGLWWTVRRLGTAQRPGLLTLSSFFVRMGFALAALYFLGGEWDRIMAALCGVVVVRVVMVRRLRPQRSPVMVRSFGGRRKDGEK